MVTPDPKIPETLEDVDILAPIRQQNLQTRSNRQSRRCGYLYGFKQRKRNLGLSVDKIGEGKDQTLDRTKECQPQIKRKGRRE